MLNFIDNALKRELSLKTIVETIKVIGDGQTYFYNHVPKFYYNPTEDVVFFEGQRVLFVFILISSISVFVVPLLLFIVYRKELNNSYKTM